MLCATLLFLARPSLSPSMSRKLLQNLLALLTVCLCACDPSSPEGDSSTRSYAHGIDFTKVEKVVLTSATDSVSLTRTPKGWEIDDDLALRAHHPALHSVFLALTNTDIGQTVEAADSDLAQLGLTPDAPSGNYKRIDFFDSLTGKSAKTLIFGDFNQPFDNTDAAVIGERFTARRYVLDPTSDTVSLAAYPFHELSARRDDWYVHNLEVTPTRIKRYTVTYPDGRTRVLSRAKRFAEFTDEEPGFSTLSTEQQKNLSDFLEEGFFPKILNPDERHNLEPIRVEILAEDFEGRFYSFQVGKEKLIERLKDPQKFAQGMMSFIDEDAQEKFPAVAVRYAVFDSDPRNAQDPEPIYELDVFLELTEFETFLNPKRQ